MIQIRPVSDLRNKISGYWKNCKWGRTCISDKERIWMRWWCSAIEA